MSLFSKLFGAKPGQGRLPASAEQAVILKLNLPTSSAEAVSGLEDQLIEIIQAQKLGEFDGNEFGGGDVTFYMYGPDAEKLFAAIQPILKVHPLCQSGKAIVRPGGPSIAAREVDLNGH